MVCPSAEIFFLSQPCRREPSDQSPPTLSITPSTPLSPRLDSQIIRIIINTPIIIPIDEKRALAPPRVPKRGEEIGIVLKRTVVKGDGDGIGSEAVPDYTDLVSPFLELSRGGRGQGEEGEEGEEVLEHLEGLGVGWLIMRWLIMRWLGVGTDRGKREESPSLDPLVGGWLYIFPKAQYVRHHPSPII